MRRLAERTLWYLTAATLTALLFVGLAISHFASSYATSTRWVSHSREVANSIAEIRSALYAAQNGRLQYVFVDQNDGLSQYRHGAEAIPSEIAELRRLTADNAKQQSLIASLTPLIDRQLTLLRTSTEMTVQGGSLELQAEYSKTIADLGKAAFAKLDELQAEEQQLAGRRQVVSEKTYQAEKIALFASFALILLFTVLNFIELMNQLRERQNAEQAVLRLSGRILQAQDEERRRIARDLHDGIGQIFTALKMILYRASQVDGESAKNLAAVEDCLPLVEEGLSQSRTLSYLLHPPMLDEIGFPSAARWLVDGFSQRSKIAVSLEISQDLKLPRDLELTLFRVLQECLTNIHRHSASLKANVRVEKKARWIVMTVTDFGKGIPAHTLENFRNGEGPSGVGLAGMRGRIEEVYGKMEVESHDSGTTITVSLPNEKLSENSKPPSDPQTTMQMSSRMPAQSPHYEPESAAASNTNSSAAN